MLASMLFTKTVRSLMRPEGRAPGAVFSLKARGLGLGAWGRGENDPPSLKAMADKRGRSAGPFDRLGKCARLEREVFLFLGDASFARARSLTTLKCGVRNAESGMKMADSQSPIAEGDGGRMGMTDGGWQRKNRGWQGLCVQR